MTKSKRLNTGKYVIKAKNEVGDDEAEVEITILGEWRHKGPDLFCPSVPRNDIWQKYNSLLSVLVCNSKLYVRGKLISRRR